MNTHYTYFFILAASFAGPIALSFDKKVAFYKKWRFVFPTMIFPALLYIVWDIYFTSNAVWSFNEQYTSGIKLINLPIEEALFFIVVPYCCLFIYECVRCYSPQVKNQQPSRVFLGVLAILLLITGAFFYEKYYTSWTFVFCAAFIGLLFFCKNFFKDFNAAGFLVSFGIMLIPFLIVNGFLTAIPVVLYNNSENLGIRIYTIPVEDTVYGMLLIMMNVAIFEKLRNRNRKPG